MSCFESVPAYIPHTEGGILSAASKGNGSTIKITWFRAFPTSSQYSLAYNIYFSTLRKDVFSEGIKYISIDPSVLALELDSFTPGDTYYFAVRATQYLSTWTNLSSLPNSGDSKIPAEGVLLSDLSSAGTEINVSDIDQFPNYGIVQIGKELIRYLNKDIPGNLLKGLTRGFLDTEIRQHLTSGFDGYETTTPLVTFFRGLEEPNEVVHQETAHFDYPNYPRTDADGYKEIIKDFITTDLSASQASEENFPRYDFAGWRRTNPLDIIRGTCIGTYIGGERFCADGYDGVGRMVRGISVNDVSAQRLEVLLDQTGDDCVLVKKMWTGKVCACFDARKEYPDDRCPLCFIPGTLVRTETGFRPIEQIKVGEKVLSSDGSYQKVTNVFENHFDGKLQSILPSISSAPIFATPEHPFMSLKSMHKRSNGCGPKCNQGIQINENKIEKRRKSYQLPSGNWHAVVWENGSKVLGTFSTQEIADEKINKFYSNKKNEPFHKLDWTEAKDIKSKDWLVAKWPTEIKDLDFIEIPQEFRKNTKLGSQRIGVDKFVVDEEFLWMLGLYIAEGSHSKRTVQFTLHKKEIEYQNRIINYFKKLGYNPKLRTYENNNGVVVAVQSTTLADWFPEWLGKKCYNKKIPEELMKLPPNKLRAILNGVYDGDGSKREHEIGQTSEILALQLVEILHRLGEQPLMRTSQAKQLTPKGNKRKLCYVVGWAEDDIKNTNRRGRWIFENDLLTKIKKVDQKDYSGPVYNLEVEGDHTYVVQGVLVHNCNGLGKITSYVQFFNPRRSDGRIKVRFDPNEDKVQLNDSGFESVFNNNAWTLVFPIIKDRDFLVRLSEDKKEEYRYEVMAVGRNKLFEGFSGAQKLTLQRVRKTDPIYNVRVNYDTSEMPSIIQTTVGFVPGPGGIPPHLHQIRIGSTKILVASQINQLTEISEGHTHGIRNGIIENYLSSNSKFGQANLGHNHQIVL